MEPKTDQSLTSTNSSQDDIFKIIQNPNKSHGPFKISIPVIKTCGNSSCKPLEMIFKSCIPKEELPSELKKANVVPLYKKWQGIPDWSHCCQSLAKFFKE